MHRSVLMLTTSSADGIEIDRYLGPVSAQVVVGTGILTDVLSGFTDLFGARSRSYESKLDHINESVLRRLEEKSRRLGGDAVVGMRVDHDEVSGGGKSMLMVTASGTAVVLRPTPTSGSSAGESSSAGPFTFDELDREMRRRRLLVESQDAPVPIESESTWRFVRETGIPELGPAVCRTLEARLQNTGLDSPRTRERLTEYLESIPHEDAVALAFAQVPTAKEAFFAVLIAVARHLHLMDYARLADGLGHPDKEVRHRMVRLLVAEPREYGPPELGAMKRCVAALETAFPPADTYVDKVGLLKSEQELWPCRCGKAVAVDKDVCSACGRNRHGFTEAQAGPSQLRDALSDKVAVLQDMLQQSEAPT